MKKGAFTLRMLDSYIIIPIKENKAMYEYKTRKNHRNKTIVASDRSTNGSLAME